MRFIVPLHVCNGWLLRKLTHNITRHLFLGDQQGRQIKKISPCKKYYYICGVLLN